jgi:hypothetical protein
MPVPVEPRSGLELLTEFVYELDFYSSTIAEKSLADREKGSYCIVMLRSITRRLVEAVTSKGAFGSICEWGQSL